MQAQQPKSKKFEAELTTAAELTIAKVLVFDSGIGGLSICKEILASNKNIKLHYLSDNAAFPYGEKSVEQLISRATQVFLQACAQLSPDLVVIACNTASTVVLPSLRTQLDIPIVGVVPAIKTAAAVSQSKTFALLATPGTVARPYTQQLIDEHAADCQVIRVGSSQLVRAIESHIHGDIIDTEYLQQIIGQLTEQLDGDKIDTVVLGCTHFPLLADRFKEIKPEWQWIDSGAAIASRVNDLLSKDTHKEHGKKSISHDLWLTKESDQQTTLDRYLAHDNFNASRILSID